MRIKDLLQTFSNGEAILELLQNELKRLVKTELREQIQPIRLLILDINMPIMDGFETLRRVKQLFEHHNALINIAKA